MQEHEPLQPLSNSQKEALEEATASYQAALTPAAARYLLDRGLSREAAVMFRVGVVANPLPGHEKFRGFLSIPYLGPDNHPLSLRFRCIEQHEHRDYGHGKYMSIAGDPARMFNVRGVHQAHDEIHVCEGEFDAMVLTMLGWPAVAIAGADGWRNHYRRMLAGFSQVWVWGDPDDAGAQFTARISRALRSAKGVRLRHGDVSETYLTGGADALRGLIRQEASA